MTKYNWCIPMGRIKIRQILAREFYGDGVGDLRAKLYDMMAKIGVPFEVDNVNDLGMKIYLHEYYPGKYLPREEHVPEHKPLALPPTNRLSEIAQSAGWSAKATLAHYRYKRLLQSLSIAN